MSLQRLGDVLPGVLRGMGLERGVQGWRAVGEWADVVGPQIAGHARAVSYDDGVLLVEVDGSAWRHELSFLERDLVRRLNDRLGAPLVNRMRFVIGRGGIQR